MTNSEQLAKVNRGGREARIRDIFLLPTPYFLIFLPYSLFPTPYSLLQEARILATSSLENSLSAKSLLGSRCSAAVRAICSSGLLATAANN